MFEFNYSIAERWPHFEICLAMHRSSAQALIASRARKPLCLRQTGVIRASGRNLRPSTLRTSSKYRAIKAGSGVRQLNTVNDDDGRNQLTYSAFLLTCLTSSTRKKTPRTAARRQMAPEYPIAVDESLTLQHHPKVPQKRRASNAVSPYARH